MTTKQTATRITPKSARRFRRGSGLVKVLAGSAAVLLLAAGGIWAVAGSGGQSGDMREVANLDLGRAEVLSFPINTTAMGELEARNQIEIRSELDETAEIVEIVEEGKVVKKGDLLIKLNTERLQDEIDEDTLEVEQARADVTARENALKIQLSDNESKYRAGLLKVELAELALNQWRQGELVKTVAKQELEVNEAREDLERLEEKYQRSKDLHAEGFLSTDELKSDKISRDRAKSRYETAILDQETYDKFQKPRDEKTKVSDVEEAQAELVRIESQNEINEAAKRAELETAKRRLELREENLKEEIEQVEKAMIYAPTGGLVVYASSVGRDRDRMMFGGDGPLQIGSQVRPNQNLIILPDTSAMVASVRVHESLAGRIRPGQRATIRVDAQSNMTYPGTVQSIGVLAETGGWRDPNRREYTVRIGLDYDNSDGTLKPSMRAEAEIMLGAVQDSLSVPVQSVFTEGPVKYVYMPRGSRFERVPVRVGRMSDTYAEILGGLSEGDRVLLREPETGEVLAGEWTREQLESVGVALDEDGNPITGSRRAEMMRMMMESGGAGGFQMQGGGQMQTEGGQPRIQRGGQGERPGGREGGQRPGGSTDAGQGARPAGDAETTTEASTGEPPAVAEAEADPAGESEAAEQTPAQEKRD